MGAYLQSARNILLSWYVISDLDQLKVLTIELIQLKTFSYRYRLQIGFVTFPVAGTLIYSDTGTLISTLQCLLQH